VSAGKYDLVEQVLKDLGAEIFFDAVAIRPGKPVVFGWCRGKPVFGLPGNPVSTMVTFELFVVPAIEALSGCPPKPLPVFKARLAHPVDEKGAVAHILPARMNWPKGQMDLEPKVEVLLWEGSGDIGPLCAEIAFWSCMPRTLTCRQANGWTFCHAVVHSDRREKRLDAPSRRVTLRLNTAS